jgi:hypothetical protein
LTRISPVCAGGAFPKPSARRDDGGYPIYCRGIGGEFVVPHSPALLLKYDCNINVELCTSVWVIKWVLWVYPPSPPLLSYPLNKDEKRKRE